MSTPTTTTTVETSAPQPVQSAPDMWGLATQLGLILVICWFVILRPQAKKLKKHQAELDAIIVGARVIVGGMVGRVTKIIDDKTLTVELSPGTHVTVLRSYVSHVLPDEQKGN